MFKPRQILSFQTPVMTVSTELLTFYWRSLREGRKNLADLQNPRREPQTKNLQRVESCVPESYCSRARPEYKKGPRQERTDHFIMCTCLANLLVPLLVSSAILSTADSRRIHKNP